MPDGQSERKKLIERLNVLEFGEGTMRDSVFLNPSSLKVEAVADFILDRERELKQRLENYEWLCENVDNIEIPEYKSMFLCCYNSSPNGPDGWWESTAEEMHNLDRAITELRARLAEGDDIDASRELSPHPASD